MLIRLVIWLVLAGLPVTELAARELNQNEILLLSREGKIMSLDSLLATALERYPGASLLEAEVEVSKKSQHYRYEVELLLKDGTVRELEFDAVTGQLILDQEDD